MAESLLSRNPAALLNRVYHTLRGQGLGFLHDLAYGPGSPLDFQLKLPKHILMITITGFPLRKHLSNGMARRCHGRLASLGPNDGTLVLADVCALPGLIYPVWGSDHYLRPEKDVSQLVLAFLQYLDEDRMGVSANRRRNRQAERVERAKPFLAWPGWAHLRYAVLWSFVNAIWFVVVYGGMDFLTARRSFRVPVHFPAELASRSFRR